ncbi:glycosyltransferase family 2 protein [Mesorhizobium sp.]|uniref:glycosyltransferase family 2 protein n=1 Tax=Mesorhizobium sp. TaxID=1871066 RepID=UPI002580629D|nr:glycosyltransferase family 2 protein [Mesorhizobium sp.]
MTDIHAVILTLNEEMHIARCIASLGGQCASVTVVDSGSNDSTIAIAEGLGAQVLTNRWVNYATQMNFAIGELVAKEGWLLRIDADEVLDADSTQTLVEAIATSPPHADGLLVRRRIHFMGNRIRHGGIEPSWQLRLWRNGRGRCEQRWMDEHITVAGNVAKSGVVFSDINLNSLSWWTAKHNSYASREAIDILSRKYDFMPLEDISTCGASPQAKARRFLKEQLYGRMPNGLRVLAYFFYRYLLRLGFMDGRPGWYFHVLQAFWYRTLVDAKVTEIEAHADTRNVPIMEAIRNCTGIELTRHGQPERRAAGM